MEKGLGKGNRPAPKTETRVWLNREISKKVDKDVGRLGASRSEVCRKIVEDYYLGRLVSAEQVLKALAKGRDEK